MHHVLLTCPRDLLCLIGCTIQSRPQRRDPASAVIAAIDKLGGSVVHAGDRFAVTFADPIDALLALGTLERTIPDYDIGTRSFVASAAAVEMLASDGEPIASAWRAFHATMETWVWEGPYPDLLKDDPGGLCVLRHFDRRYFLKHAVPLEVAQQRLPTTGLVLWNVGDNNILHVETTWSNYEVSFERENGTWQVRDLASPFGLYVDGQFAGGVKQLQPGMVVLRPRPHAFVVLGAS